MGKTTGTNQAKKISTAAARLAIATIVSYQVLLVVLIFLRPDLDPSWHTISEWAIGRYGEHRDHGEGLCGEILFGCGSGRASVRGFSRHRVYRGSSSGRFFLTPSPAVY